jgi:exopolysaccharide biosynthesis polyprenyl glycosylphosphotransferase
MAHNSGPTRRRFDQRFVALLALADIAACSAGLLAAYAVRHWFPHIFHSNLHQPITVYSHALPWVLALWLITFHALGLYEVRRFVSRLAQLAATSRAASLATLLVAAASFLSKISYSRAMLPMFWVFATALACALRFALGGYRRWAMTRGGMAARAVVIGCGDLGRVAARRMREYGTFGYDPIGFVSACDDLEEGVDEIEGFPVLGQLPDLARIVGDHQVDEVLVARPDISTDDLMTAVQSCERLPVEFHLIAGPLDVLTANTEFSGVADLPVVELKARDFPPWKRFTKRIMDLVGGTVLLTVSALPMLLIAWLIRRQTGGSAMFKQTRIGYRGREFTMYKFRTMYGDADPYAPSPADPGDERITPVGRFLRRFSLDELPQLFNVLKGDMSLVGPRPEMPFLVEQYRPWQRRRLEAKPGMTGLWQILGRKDLPLIDNIEYDFYYIRNQSLLLDITILLKTVAVVLNTRGAY